MKFIIRITLDPIQDRDIVTYFAGVSTVTTNRTIKQIVRAYIEEEGGGDVITNNDLLNAINKISYPSNNNISTLPVQSYKPHSRQDKLPIDTTKEVEDALRAIDNLGI